MFERKAFKNRSIRERIDNEYEIFDWWGLYLPGDSTFFEWTLKDPIFCHAKNKTQRECPCNNIFIAFVYN